MDYQDVQLANDGLTALQRARRSAEYHCDRAIEATTKAYKQEAQIKRISASLQRLLEEFDFMVESGLIPDVRNDVIFAEARAALAELEGAL